jgi:glycosyltransferase involved in cell wall biosynthesis
MDTGGDNSRRTIGVVIPTTGLRTALHSAFGSVLLQTRLPDAIRVACDCDDLDAAADFCDLDRAAALGIDAQVVAARATVGTLSGPSAARNAGLHALKTDFVACLDDDDLWLPTHLELLERAADNPAVLAYTRSVRLQGAGPVVVWPPHNRHVGRVEVAALLLAYPANHTSCLIPRAVFDRVGGYDEDLFREEDVDLLIRLAEHLELRLVEDVTHVIFRHDGATRAADLAIASRRALIEKHQHRLSADEQVRAWRRLAYWAWRLGRHDEAVSIARDHTTPSARFIPGWLLRRYFALRTNRELVARIKRFVPR